MQEIIERKLGENGELSPKVCEEFGLSEYDPSNYIELETLGKGGFGIVKRCKFIPKHEFHAIKKVNMQGISRKEMLSMISSYLVEYEIFSKKLNQIQHPNIAAFKGGHFITNAINNSSECLVLFT